MKYTTIFDGTIFGTPKPQPRPRAFSRGGKTRMYDPGTSEDWKKEVGQQTTVLHRKNLQGCLKVGLYFFFDRPRSHFKTDAISLKSTAPKWYFSKRPDVDNLAKAVLDALTALNVWGDDSQVVILEVTKVWAPDKRSGCVLSILTIDENEI